MMRLGGLSSCPHMCARRLLCLGECQARSWRLGLDRHRGGHLVRPSARELDAYVARVFCIVCPTSVGRVPCALVPLLCVTSAL